MSKVEYKFMLCMKCNLNWLQPVHVHKNLKPATICPKCGSMNVRKDMLVPESRVKEFTIKAIELI